jgi:hypothetical protein
VRKQETDAVWSTEVQILANHRLEEMAPGRCKG